MSQYIVDASIAVQLVIEDTHISLPFTMLSTSRWPSKWVIHSSQMTIDKQMLHKMKA